MKTRQFIVASLLFTFIPLLAAADPIVGESGSMQTFTYKKTDQKELKIFIHFPADWKPTDTRPAMVFFFGGGWVKGNPGQFQRQAEYFASRGLVTARADYRLNIGPTLAVEDAKSAIRFVRAHAKELGIDPSRIVGSGGSAGGHLAAATTLCPGIDAAGEDTTISSQPNAMVLFNPVMDMRQLAERFTLTPAQASAISPNVFESKDSPPCIMFFGSEDQLAAYARDYIAASKKLGNRAELYIAPGQKHGFFNTSPWTEATAKQADQFLATLGYLKGDATMKPPAAGEAKLERQ